MAQKNIFQLLSLATLFLALPLFLSAQNICVYQLQLEDSFGDGWEGSFVSLTINGQETRYGLGDGDDDESSQTIEVALTTGDSLVLRYGTEGEPVFQNEISYRLLDSDGLVVVEAGPNPETGVIVEVEILCPACATLNSDLIRIIEVSATSAAVFWDIEIGEQVLLEIGEMGFEQGRGTQRTIAEGTTIVDNLEENTNYDIYLNRICPSGEQSRPLGPFSFKTLFVNPPDTCFYTLRMLDFFGDGWNGSSLTATSNGEATNYTLENGAIEVVQIPVLRNLSFQVAFNGGLFDEEISYVLLDPEGNTILSEGPSPQTGTVLEIVACPSCPPPLNPQANPAAESAIVSWEDIDAATTFILEYGEEGLELGSGLEVVSDEPSIRLSSLKENTTYEYYLKSLCGEEETSLQIAGPFSLTTLFKKDVGIANITMPTSACGLGVSETIEIELKNFGANPQSLVTYKFSVNGVDGSVPVPTDGFYTGIISKDSVAIIEFETPTDLMRPGIYEIAVWSELEGDANSSNDTSRVIITNIPNIQSYPYSEPFSTNGGWTVATESMQSSWEFGTPQTSTFRNAYSGEQVWATNVAGDYNASEISYLLSPCLDFSSLEVDPTIAFRLFMEVPEFSGARFFLEMSLNDGRWQRVGQNAEGFNWYNNETQTAWEEGISAGAWVYAEQQLLNTAGIEDVRLRFTFIGEGGEEVEGFGVAIDDLHIFQSTSTNAVARAVSNFAQSGCGAKADKVNLLLRNSGTDPIQQLEVGYRINEEVIVTELVDTFLLPNESLIYEFAMPFNSQAIGEYRLQSWVSVVGDNTPISDTTYAYFEVLPPNPLPLIEDFNDEMVDTGWFAIIGGIDFSEPDDHNNETYVLSDNMWFGNPISEFITASYGPINEGDSLNFKYRLAEWPDATIPLELTEDTLTISISTNCGATLTPIYVVHQGNHIPTADFTNITVPLSDYVGAGVSFSFSMQWGNGDYWFDIDDINVLSCPATLALQSEVVDASGAEANDGTIFIAPTQGSGAYIYDWENSMEETATLDSLLPGIYQVFVTDDLLGCQDSIEVEVGILSTSTSAISIIEEAVIYPNPTAYSAQLGLTLRSPESTAITIYNVVGQPVKSITTAPSLIVTTDLELGDLPKGIYWIQIAVGEAFITRKVFKVD